MRSIPTILRVLAMWCHSDMCGVHGESAGWSCWLDTIRRRTPTCQTIREGTCGLRAEEKVGVNGGI